MWVRLMEWTIADEAPPMPEVGSLLTHVGLRVHGAVTPAQPDSPDAIVETHHGQQPHEVMYRLTGRADEPRDFDIDPTGVGSRHAGAEFVLTVGSDRYQVQTDDWARDMQPWSRVTVTGRLAVVGDYEWDAFGLAESRADWHVKAVALADHGDSMLDLLAASNG